MELNNLDINKIYPTEDRLLMETYSHAETTSEGLEQVEENTNTAPVIGKVIRAGEKSKYEVGQILMWRRYSLDILKIPTSEGDVEYNLLEDSEVVAVVENGGVEQPDRYEQIKRKKELKDKEE